jgi:hypothetical protein
MEMKEECKIEGCKNPAESSTGLCHEHEVEARQREADEQADFEAGYEDEGDDEDEEDE